MLSSLASAMLALVLLTTIIFIYSSMPPLKSLDERIQPQNHMREQKDLVEMCVESLDVQYNASGLKKLPQPFKSLKSTEKYCRFSSNLNHNTVVSTLQDIELVVVGDSTYRRLSAGLKSIQDNNADPKHRWAHWTMDRSSSLVKHTFLWSPSCSDVLETVGKLANLTDNENAIQTGTPFAEKPGMPCWNQTTEAQVVKCKATIKQ